MHRDGKSYAEYFRAMTITRIRFKSSHAGRMQEKGWGRVAVFIVCHCWCMGGQPEPPDLTVCVLGVMRNKHAFSVVQCQIR